MYDIIVIGAGPAGLTAALYALRANKKVLVLEKSTFGGQVTFSPAIENYPGYAIMSGNEFADKLIEQVINQGADIEMEKVISIKTDGNIKTVVTDTAEHEAKAVIIATGVKHRQTGVKGENELVGNGISYCAVCDGAFFKGRTVAVLGGGNSALQEAVLLSDLCKKVYILQNLAFLTGEQKLVEKVNNAENIEVIYEIAIDSFIGTNELEGLNIKNVNTGTVSSIAVEGLFVAIGLIPDNERFSNVAALDEQGYFDSSENCLTKTDGIYIAGDCRKKNIRQITTATADGAIAALNACRYIDNLE